MFEVKLFDLDSLDNPELTRVVCVTTYKGKLVYAKHKERNTWELPGGHIEEGETWEDACKREMYEETGAIDIEVKPICYYKISTYGILCFCNIKKLESIPDSEIEKIAFFSDEPKDLTYSETHHLFLEKAKQANFL